MINLMMRIKWFYVVGEKPVSARYDGGGYEIAKTLGHKIIEPFPALVQLKLEGKYLRELLESDLMD